jgi:glycosyltransferase involved in cell wall biosynthesis
VKVLLVSHLYPPEHAAGTEQYAAQLAAGLLARGHGAEVFCATKDVSRPHLSVARREQEGVAVHELVNNLEYGAFRETYELPAAEAAFERALDEARPDLVHVHHLLNLSWRLPELARRRGLPVVMTLHDYWLQCARGGQRLDERGELCLEVERERCARCLGAHRWRNSPLEQRVGRALARVRAVSGLDLSGPARRLGDALRAREGGEAPAPLPAADLAARDEALLSRLPASVDLFLSPSAFLRDEIVRAGLPRERVRHLPSGVETRELAGERAPRRDRLRIGFLGSLIPVKGAHVLLEALERLPAAERDALEVTLHGPAKRDLSYAARLRELAAATGASLAGPLDRAGVGEFLRRTDLLVVPSLWFENQPLVVLEALAAGARVVASDLGGLVELVRPGHGGARFPAGDAAALSTLLGELARDPARLEALGPPARVPDLAEQHEAILAVHRELLP